MAVSRTLVVSSSNYALVGRRVTSKSCFQPPFAIMRVSDFMLRTWGQHVAVHWSGTGVPHRVGFGEEARFKKKVYYMLEAIAMLKAWGLSSKRLIHTFMQRRLASQGPLEPNVGVYR